MEAAGDPAGTLLHLPPGRHVRMSLQAALPATAKRGSADVWRIVEHILFGRITGGVTIIVQANQKKGNQNAATSRRASSV